MISVIIPTYNREKTILRSINSVLNQTYKDIEVIVVDDGSTDNTKTIVESVQDLRVRYVYQKNAGACAARNKGIEMAVGEYIAFQDSDDEWVSNKLELQIDALVEKNVDVCFCDVSRIYNINKKPIRTPNLSKSDYIEHRYFCVDGRIGTPTILAKKEVFANHKFDEKVFRAQDRDWAIRASQEYFFYYVNMPLHIAYLQENSIVQGGLKSSIKTRLYWLEKYKEKCLEDKEFHANILKCIARWKTILNEEDAIIYYKRLYKIDKNPKIFIELCLSQIGILSLLVSWRNKLINKTYY